MTSQLTLITAPRPRGGLAKLDARTRETGLKGVAQAREVLRKAGTRTAA